MQKNNTSIALPSLSKLGKTWQSESQKCIRDPRFFNVNSLEGEFWGAIIDAKLDRIGRKFLFRQLVSKYRFKDVGSAHIELLKEQSQDPDFRIIELVLRNYHPIPIKKKEIHDLLFLV